MWTVVVLVKMNDYNADRHENRFRYALCAFHFFFCFCFVHTQPVRLFPSRRSHNYTSCLVYLGTDTHTRKHRMRWKKCSFRKYAPFRLTHDTGEYFHRFRRYTHTACSRWHSYRLKNLLGVVCARAFVCVCVMRVWWQQRHSAQYSFSVGVCLQAKQVFNEKTWSVFSSDTFCVILPNNLFNLILKFKRQTKTKLLKWQISKKLNSKMSE